jgi:hypothetical protein
MEIFKLYCGSARQLLQNEKVLSRTRELAILEASEKSM